MLLVMTVEPGLRRPEVPRPVPAQDPARPRADRQARRSRPGCRSTAASRLETIERCAEAGADVFVAGSAVFDADDPDAMVEALRDGRAGGRARLRTLCAGRHAAGRARCVACAGQRRANSSRALGSVKFRTGGESPRPGRSQWPVDQVELLDRRSKSGWEAHAGGRRRVERTSARRRPSTPRSPRAGPRGRSDDLQRRRAGGDAARPRAGRARPACRSAPTRGSAACCSTPDGRDGRRGLPPRRRHAARRGRRPGPGRRPAPGAPPPWSPSSPATTPAAPVPARRRWSTAGVRRVVFAQPDPNPVAAGGADDPARRRRRRRGRAAGRRGARPQPGVDVRGRARPARSSPGSSPPPSTAAAPPPTARSRWVSSRAARLDTHRLRALCDAMLVGTGTVAVDDPQLTVRDEHDEPLPATQPLRVVMGERDLDPRPAGPRRRRRDAAPAHPRPRRGARRAVRPRPAARLPRGRPDARRGVPAAPGLVDEVVAYVAPMLLGAGPQRGRRPGHHHDRRRAAPRRSPT